MSGQIIPNSFTTYALTEEDALTGSVFTPLQKQVLNNHLASLAEEKLTLEFDVNNDKSFIQQEAYKTGQIKLLQYLLDNSQANQELLENPPQL